MTPYLLIMAVFAVLAALAPQRKPGRAMWVLSFILLVVFIGLRHKVGMDWNNYLAMAAKVDGVSFRQALSFAEPGYSLLLWASVSSGFGVYGANLIGSAVFVFGLLRFSRTTPEPWIAVTAAMPYLVVVAAMSVNRQAIAIGILMWLVADWARLTLTRRLLLILMAALFHFSAIVFVIFAVLGLRMGPVMKAAAWVSMPIIALLFLQFTGGAQTYDELYFSGQTELTFSPGATLHVLFNGIPGLLIFLSKRFRARLFPSMLHIQMALAAILLIPVALVFSAAAGRATLYLFPVSMYVLSALPGLFSQKEIRSAARLIIGAAYASLLWFWLVYANSAIAHIPYSNVFSIENWELQL